jgi:RimJ/RimL family protein N-acetyltransferase
MTNPRLWDWLSSDDAGAAADFTPDPSWLYLAVHDADELLGVFCVAPRNSVCCEVHTCLLPCAWGGRARTIYRLGLIYLRATTNYRKVIGNIRTTNRLALRIAEGAGLKRIGLNRRCALKNGELIDQWILGLEL